MTLDANFLDWLAKYFRLPPSQSKAAHANIQSSSQFFETLGLPGNQCYGARLARHRAPRLRY